MASLKSRSTGVLSAQEWLDLADDPTDGIVFGTSEDEIIEMGTKNAIEGSPKCFKTTFLLTLLLAASKGKTAYPAMPLFGLKPRRVLYFHGEMSKRQIKKRTIGTSRGLERPLDNFFQVRDLDAHLLTTPGQGIIKRHIDEIGPTDVAFDPWQSFIKGHNENDGQEVSKAANFIDQLILDKDVTVWLPVHTGKDSSRGMRGHSYLEGWRDGKIKLTRNKSTLTVNVEPRSSSAIDPFKLRFDEGQLVSCGADGTAWSPQAVKIREVVERAGGKVRREDVGTALGLEGDALRKALGRAEKDGAIIVSSGHIALPSRMDRV